MFNILLMQFFSLLTSFKMNNYLIKQHKNNKSHTISNYFFNIVDQLTYEKKMNYFISNALSEEKYTDNYYFLLPLKILNILYQSIIDNSSNKVKFTNAIYITNDLWSCNYFNDKTIYLYKQKKKIMVQMNYHMSLFFDLYLKDQTITKEAIERFTNVFNERGIMDLLEKQNNDFSYFNSISDYFIDESAYINANEYDTYDNIEEDYMKLLKEFIKNSIQLLSLLDNWDNNNSDNQRYMYIKRVEITRLYSGVILRMIFGDVINVIKKHLQDTKLQIVFQYEII